MILKALYDYYQRCENMAPTGMEYKEIAFLIVIDRNGEFVRIDNKLIDNKNGSIYLVHKTVGRSGAKRVANLLWDNSSYVLGFSKANLPVNETGWDEEKKRNKRNEREKEQLKNIKNFRTFLFKIDELTSMNPDNEEIKAISLFYKKSREDILQELSFCPEWTSFCKNINKNISFLIDGETEIVAETSFVYSQEDTKKVNPIEKGKPSFCLITGKEADTVDITTATPIIGGQATAKLVAFQVNSGYDSYGKMKGQNAPISQEAEFRYTTALNQLLKKDSHNKFMLSNRTFVFWASSNSNSSKEAEQGLYNLLFNKEENNDPNARIIEVQKTFNAIYSGSLETQLNDRFYMLGLAPNSARIAVVFWSDCSLRDFAGNILRHFEDMKIYNAIKEQKPYRGIHQILSAIALKGEESKVQPNIPEAVLKSIISGIPYPYSLFYACIKRIRATQTVTKTRAAIIKGYLNRLNINNLKINDLKINDMIDKENKNQGYLCGRLFATLEYLQERSNNGHSTIRSRYMNSASATPAAVFPTILNLSIHHADKLDKGGQIYFENIKAEIIDKISPDGFPSHLSLEDQGRFMVGYYHQRQVFYTKKSSEEKEINVEQ